MALMTIIIIRTNNVGINKRTIRSMPPITPAARIAILNPIKTVCQNSNLGAEAVTQDKLFNGRNTCVWHGCNAYVIQTNASYDTIKRKYKNP